jgi:hypothetical protein
MALLDFKHWQVEHADKQKATLKHKDGHSMTLAISALPKIQQQHLRRLVKERMADGGPVKDEAVTPFTHDPSLETSTPEVEYRNGIPQSKGRGNLVNGSAYGYGQSSKEAASRPINSYAEGTPDEPVTKEEEAGLPSAMEGLKALGRFVSQGPAVTDAALEGREPTPKERGEVGNPVVPTSPATHITINAAPQPATGPQGLPPAFNQPVEAPAATAPSVALAAPRTAAPSQLSADVQEAAAQKLQQDQAAIEAQTAKFNEYKTHADEFAQYMRSNPINPNAWAENRSTAQKVSTAIALMLGGFQSGFRGGPNPVMEFLNKQIDRDIEAQKARAEQQATVYGAYRHLYGDSITAYNLTKAAALDVYNDKMQKAAAQLGTPQAAMKAQLFNNEVSIAKDRLLLDALKDSQQSPAKGQKGPGPLSILKPGAAKMAMGLNDPDVNAMVDRANAAENALKATAEMFPIMEKNATGSRYYARPLVTGAGALGSIIGEVVGKGSAAGGAAGAGLGAAGAGAVTSLMSRKENNRYDAARALWIKQTAPIVAKGGGISPTEAESILDKITPNYVDTTDPEAYNLKLNGMLKYFKQIGSDPRSRQRGITY